jgi:hypothetical protein
MAFRRTSSFLLAIAVAAGLAYACGGVGFDPQSKVESVRILASEADHPYATPGETVNLQVLAFDGRQIQPEPMRVFWLPLVCTNPTNDLYYACFGGLAGGDGGVGSLDAGGLGSTDGGAPNLGLLKPGVDLTPLLTEGSSFSFTLRPDIITSHEEPPKQTTPPYGLAIAFNIACAGHVELLPVDSSSVNPIQIPIGCFDANHNQLGPDDYVIGFTRVYAYATLTNANPVISQVVFDGNPVDVDAGVTVPRCTAKKTSSCTSYALDIVVPPSSQEVDPGNVGPDGQQRREEIWVDYFNTLGNLDDDGRLLYDPISGPLTNTATKYEAPTSAGEGMLWAVVHDNRGGAAWEAVPVHVQ